MDVGWKGGAGGRGGWRDWGSNTLIGKSVSTQTVNKQPFINWLPLLSVSLAFMPRHTVDID